MIRQHLISPLILVGLIAACGYIFYSGLHGNHGLIQQRHLEDERVKLEGELQLLHHEVAFMKNKTERLSERFLDLELLDEQARKVLGLVHVDELVVN